MIITTTLHGELVFRPQSDADRIHLERFTLSCVRGDSPADVEATTAARTPQIISSDSGGAVVTDGRQVVLSISSRTNVITHVLQERGRQDRQWGGADHDDEHTPGEWIKLVEAFLTKARKCTRDKLLVEYRHRLLSIAALCVAAVEARDRKVGGES